MAEDTSYLNKAYKVENIGQTRKFYADWADTYDAEVRKYGYVTPGRCAAALAGLAPDLLAPVLDVGCGTGLSGLALRDAGFGCVDGCDLSPEMLRKAAKHVGLYRKLRETDLSEPFPFTPGTYAHIAAMGVIATGHAPPETIDEILSALPSGGLFVFSLNDHTLEDPAFEARIAENTDTGEAVLLFKEHGPHLPGYGLESSVYILQKS
jgi:predicted TPR repeat methyltransferase